MKEKEFLLKIKTKDNKEKRLIDNCIWLLDNLEIKPSNIDINLNKLQGKFTFIVNENSYEEIEINSRDYYYCQYVKKENRKTSSAILQKYYSFMPGRYLTKKTIFFLNKEMEFFRLDIE